MLALGRACFNWIRLSWFLLYLLTMTDHHEIPMYIENFLYNFCNQTQKKKKQFQDASGTFLWQVIQHPGALLVTHVCPSARPSLALSSLPSFWKGYLDRDTAIVVRLLWHLATYKRVVLKNHPECKHGGFDGAKKKTVLQQDFLISTDSFWEISARLPSSRHQ